MRSLVYLVVGAILAYVYFTPIYGFLQRPLKVTMDHVNQVRINRQIHELAPVLNSPDVTDGASVASSEERVPIDIVVKRHAGKTYLFAVAMRDGDATASFTLPGTGDTRVEVLGEGRTIEAVDGRWEDRFEGYQVHLYRIGPNR